jgi:uncharacterized membrane-anchored protein YhcB (DUF1043 family)
MSWLAKIHLKTVIRRLGPFRSALLLFSVIAICLFCGYRFGNFFHQYQQKILEQQQLRLDELYQKQSKQVKIINQLKVELEVERLANNESQKLLKKIEQDHYQVKKQLAFYEKVMAPEKQADGIVIEDFSVQATQSEDHFRFQVVLMQQQSNKRFVKGHIKLSIVGSLIDQPKKISLNELSPMTDQQLSFSFKYFQIIEGEFTLPDSFIAEKIELAAILPKRKWQKGSRIDQNYLWPTVIEANVDNAIR